MMLTLQHVRPFQAVGTPRAGRTAGRVATVVRAAKSGNSNQQRPVSRYVTESAGCMNRNFTFQFRQVQGLSKAKLSLK